MNKMITVPTSPIKTIQQPKLPKSDVLAGFRKKVEQDIVLFKLASLKPTKDSPRDDYEDVVGDWRLSRFLQSVEGNVEEALVSFRQHLKWRISVNAESIRVLIREKPFRICSFPNAALLTKSGMKAPCIDAGRSRLGDLVHLESVGQGDARELLKQATEQQLLDHYVGFFESRSMLLESESASAGKIVRTIQVRDMSNFGLQIISERSALSTLQNLVKIGAENYPESTAYALFTRTPGIFTSVWGLVSRILPARTVKKVRFVSLADTPSTLMRYVQPQAIVALQRLTWGEDGDQIADDVAAGVVSKSFGTRINVGGRGVEHVYAALADRQKCSFRVLDEDGADVTGFANVICVPREHNVGVDPDSVDVRTVANKAKGSASCPKEAHNCLVVISIENNSWFSSKNYTVDVQIFCD